MINAVQCQSVPDQICSIDTKCQSIEMGTPIAHVMGTLELRYIWNQYQKFDPALIGIDQH